MSVGLRNTCLAIGASVMLSACVDPLRDVDRLSGVELAEDAPAASIASSATDSGSGGGFLSRLLGETDTAAPVSATDAAVQSALADEGVTDVPAELAAEASAAVLEPEATPRGLFGFLRPKAEAQDTNSQAEPELPSTDDAVVAALMSDEKTETVTDAVDTAEARPRRGLFGLLSGARAKSDDTSEGAQVQTASLGPSITADRAQPNRKGRRGHKGPDVTIVPMGTTLQSGVVARVCDLPRNRLGKEISRFPERGRGYKMFDSKPNSTAPRPFYITGFDDGCARTFTAALALFGSPSMHEQLRYGLPSKEQPYSTTDKAYEGIKRSVCGVSKGKPCGAKVKLLEKDTVFVSIYDRFGSNASWSNILLHKGWVLAADRKG